MDYHISNTAAILLGLLAVWEITWKGLALWRAAQHKQLVWYIAILFINTVGILPIVYLLLTNNDKTAQPNQE